MAVGYSRTKADMDARIGSMALTFRSIMTDVDRLQELGNALDDAALQAMGYGGDTATQGTDIWILRGVIEDMVRLVSVARGHEVVDPAYDFTRKPRMVMGVQ